MQKYDIFPILQKGLKHFKESHGMSFNVWDDMYTTKEGM